MASGKTRSARGRGYSITHALVVVVVLGVGITVAIPRMWTARADALDATAIGQVGRAIESIDAYRRRHGRVPVSPEEAGLSIEAGLNTTMWVRQIVGGVESVHLHIEHGRSGHTFHANYPFENGVTRLPPEWEDH